MSKNPLLLGWLMDTKDDCFPYYLSKLEFLQMYGKQCSQHEGTCKSAKTEKECNVKRVLKCTYTEGECVKVVDAICNYYDKDGNVKEEEWGEEQITYIDDLYKTAVNVKFGEFMLGKDYNKTVKTNAFQMISEKFNHVDYNSSDDTGCVTSIKSILMANGDFMGELIKMRERAYNNMAKEHSQPFTFSATIKNSELALYVFELLKTKKCGNYKTIFSHHKDDDSKILDILTKKGVCFQEEHENDKTSSFFNLGNFDKEDFEYKDGISLSSFVWDLQKTVFNTVKNAFMGLGNIVLTIPRLIMKSLFSGSDTVKTIVTIGLLLFGIIVIIGGIIYLSTAGTSTALVVYTSTPLLSTGSSFSIFSFLAPVMGQMQMLLDMLNRVFCSISPFFKFNMVITFLAKSIHSYIHATSDIAGSVYGKLIELFLGLNTVVSKVNIVKMSIDRIEHILRTFSIDFFLSPLSMFTSKMQCANTNIKNKVMGLFNSYFSTAQECKGLVPYGYGPNMYTMPNKNFNPELYEAIVNQKGQGINDNMSAVPNPYAYVPNDICTEKDNTGLAFLFNILNQNLDYIKGVFSSSGNFTYLKTFLSSASEVSFSKLTEYLGVLSAIIITFFNNVTGLTIDITNSLYKNVSADIYKLYQFFMSFEFSMNPKPNMKDEIQKRERMYENLMAGFKRLDDAQPYTENDIKKYGYTFDVNYLFNRRDGTYNGKDALNELNKNQEKYINNLYYKNAYTMDTNKLNKLAAQTKEDQNFFNNYADKSNKYWYNMDMDMDMNYKRLIMEANKAKKKAEMEEYKKKALVPYDYNQQVSYPTTERGLVPYDYNQNISYPKNENDTRNFYMNVGLKVGLLALGLIGSKLLYDRYKNRTVKNKKTVSASIKTHSSPKAKTLTPKKSIRSASIPNNSLPMSDSNSFVDGKYRRCPNGKHRNRTTRKCEPV